jgi:site-specific DNA-methyltransferase (cytosine-N4-specific)
MQRDSKSKPFYETKLGRMYCVDSLEFMRAEMNDSSIDLIMTSPPFGLVRKKTYGNVDANNYLTWFHPFGLEFHRLLKPHGSLVIDIGGAWNRGQPTRSLYHFELLIMLCKDLSFNLAQEIFWWNPSKLPTPAEWVTVRRVRVKDAVNCIWWLSKTPWPRASNRRVLAPYSDSMKSLLNNGYKAKKRPSGHDISTKFNIDNKASIPPNLLAIPNTESNSYYLRYCKEKGLTQHPARFPSDVPEFFIRMLTDPGELIFDPFAGSCVTGEVAERLKRRWICCDNVEEYLAGALGRFENREATLFPDLPENKHAKEIFYKIYHPSAMWSRLEDHPLSEDGGLNRQLRSKTEYPDSDTKSKPASVCEKRTTYGTKSKQKIKTKTKTSMSSRKREGT